MNIQTVRKTRRVMITPFMITVQQSESFRNHDDATFLYTTGDMLQPPEKQT
jgi:hypothetical protein